MVLEFAIDIKCTVYTGIHGYTGTSDSPAESIFELLFRDELTQISDEEG